jgi:hypothetical protein
MKMVIKLLLDIFDYYVIAFKSVNKVDIFINKREIEDYITRVLIIMKTQQEVNTVGRV